MTNDEIRKQLLKLNKETLIGILTIFIELQVDGHEEFLEKIKMSDRGLRAHNRLKKMGWTGSNG